MTRKGNLKQQEPRRTSAISTFPLVIFLSAFRHSCTPERTVRYLGPLDASERSRACVQICLMVTVNSRYKGVLCGAESGERRRSGAAAVDKF